MTISYLITLRGRRDGKIPADFMSGLGQRARNFNQVCDYEKIVQMYVGLHRTRALCDFSHFHGAPWGIAKLSISSRLGKKERKERKRRIQLRMEDLLAENGNSSSPGWGEKLSRKGWRTRHLTKSTLLPVDPFLAHETLCNYNPGKTITAASFQFHVKTMCSCFSSI